MQLKVISMNHETFSNAQNIKYSRLIETKGYFTTMQIVNSCVAMISLINERINKSIKRWNINISKEEIDNEALGWLSEHFEEKDLNMDEIHMKMPKIQKIKNALAHVCFYYIGSFKGKSDPNALNLVELDTFSNGKSYAHYGDESWITIDSDHIKGNISLDMLIYLTEFYYWYYRKLEAKSTGVSLETFDNDSEYINQVMESLSIEERAKIDNYINNYIGREKYENLSTERKATILDTAYNFIIKKIMIPDFVFLRDYRNILMLEDIDYYNEVESELKPFFYVSQLCTNAFYIFDYMREINHSSDNFKNFFDYQEMDFLNINPYFRNPKEKIFTYPNREIYDKRLSEYKDELKKMETSIKRNNILDKSGNELPIMNNERMNILIANIFKIICQENKDINKEQVKEIFVKVCTQKYDINSFNSEQKCIFNIIKKKLKDFNDNKNMKYKVDDLVSEYLPNKDIKNYGNIMRHLRNAVAHGYYTFDYSSISKTSDLNNIKITLEDYDEIIDPETHISEKVLSFKLTITCEEFQKIIDNCAQHIENNNILEQARRNKIEEFERTNVKR